MRKVLQSVKQDNDVFAKAKCRLCGDNVSFALKTLPRKNMLIDTYREITKMKMAKIMEKYFT